MGILNNLKKLVVDTKHDLKKKNEIFSIAVILLQKKFDGMRSIFIVFTYNILNFVRTFLSSRFSVV